MVARFWCVAAGLLLSVGCGSSTQNGRQPGGAGAGGDASSGAGGGSGTVAGAGQHGGGFAGTSCGPDCNAGGVSGDSAATKACRDYFTAVCARVRECGVSSYGPCESPIDVCPDHLFADGSGWSVDAVVACTADWKQHGCDALENDEGPACSQVAGTRPVGDACVFDQQCASGLCNVGVGDTFRSDCGTCAEPTPSHGACDEAHVCPFGESCDQGRCVDQRPPVDPQCVGVTCSENETCREGGCVGLKQAGGVCDLFDRCAAGLGCQIALVAQPDPEPATGTCEALPPAGQPCLPSFGHRGLCADGASCDASPTGMCVPLAAVGEPCGYNRCVPDAYCQVMGYESLPSQVCTPLSQAGEPCPSEGRDGGNTACAGDLWCVCPTPGCETGICSIRRNAGDACSASEPCPYGLACLSNVCVDPDTEPATRAAGMPCHRNTAYGRETHDCLEGLECLCPDAACAQPICATAREAGETCGSETELCRRGLACSQGTCREVTSRDLEAAACAP